MRLPISADITIDRNGKVIKKDYIFAEVPLTKEIASQLCLMSGFSLDLEIMRQEKEFREETLKNKQMEVKNEESSILEIPS